ncbi:uncharacterized protein DFE_0604 [Desulfovibrio ferrophilus]|uniref:Uncharacterized protein n=1 Tax=Desulfovibrio ferrophilus TaxID=241368 RepID=A0A2Z6AVT9_9BACT|nr:uncharacterized protein DFE_0604 [Desulfovibrio ferrophilus]
MPSIRNLLQSSFLEPVMPGQEAYAWLTALMAVAGVTAPIKAFLPRQNT